MSMNLNVKWINYFFDIAKLTASMSKDPSTKVGAIFVTADKPHRVLSTGYNGFCHGVNDDPERYNDRETKLQYVVHAEANGIVSAASLGVSLKGTVVFVTAPPCIECSKLMIQLGVAEVFFIAERMSAEQRKNIAPNDWRSIRDKSFRLFHESNIRIWKCQWDDDGNLYAFPMDPSSNGFEEQLK